MLDLSKEFMMALFIGATSFAGLTAVVIGQVINSNHARKQGIKSFLAYSFAAGIIAAFLSFAWFLSQNGLLQLIAVIAFFAQIVWCFIVTWSFWTT